MGWLRRLFIKAIYNLETFVYTGHAYLKSAFNAEEVVMMMCAENMRVALTEHVP